MKTLYIDCRMGISGAKLLGALLEIIGKPEQFLRKFNELGFEGMSLDREDEAINGVTGSRIYFKRENNNPDYNEYGGEVDRLIKIRRRSGSDHSGSSQDRKLADVKAIIDDLPLKSKVRTNALKIYEEIAAQRAKVRGRNSDEVHLKRTGSKDIIASVVGVCMLIDELNCDKIVASTVTTGTGYTKTSRGSLPVPVPVVANLLEGIPTTHGTEEEEMCTVEGAAILKNFVDEFSDTPDMFVQSTGVGFGRELSSRNINCLKVYIGTPMVTADVSSLTELKAIIYDESTLSGLSQKLEALGVREAYTYPVLSLDGKSGTALKCICPNDVADRVADEILANTSAAGVVRSAVSVYEP